MDIKPSHDKNIPPYTHTYTHTHTPSTHTHTEHTHTHTGESCYVSSSFAAVAYLENDESPLLVKREKIKRG